VRDEGMAALAAPSVERWVAPQTRSARPEHVAAIEADLLGLDREVFTHYAEMMATADVTDDLPNIAAPTLVVVGRSDQSSPVPAAEHLAAAIPDARLRVIEDARHLVHLDRPAELTDLVVRFLGSASTAWP